MNDLDCMIIFAARYAHNRNTGAALMVVNCAIKNWDELSKNTKKQLSKEAQNEAVYNMECWQRLIDKY